MSPTEWKAVLGKRLKELRERAHAGKGLSTEKAAATIRRTPAYIYRLENAMEGENPTINMLFQLCSLYGFEIGDLFAPLSPGFSALNLDLKEKLDFILLSGVERTVIGITENVHAMYQRTIELKTR